MAAMMAIVGLIGTGLQVMGSMQQASAQKAQAEYNAKVQERQGKIEYAKGQEIADQKRREAKIAESRAIAVAAASGAGAYGSPTVNETLADIYSGGDYQAREAMFDAEVNRENRYSAAALSRAQGKSAAQGSIISGIGSAFGGFSKAMYG